MRFLSESQILECFSHVSLSLDELSPHLRNGLEPQDGGAARDYAGLLELGIDGVLAPLAAHQPKAYSALMAMSPKILVGETLWTDASGIPIWLSGAFIGADERYVRIAPYLPELSIAERGEKSVYFYRYASLPLEIAEAYYSQVCGMEVLQHLPGNPRISRVLPARIDVWGVRGDSICGPGRKDQAAMKAAFASIADPLLAVRKNEPVWESFACILDSREQFPPDEAGDRARNAVGSTGDFLFVQERSLSRRIFHVHDANFSEIRIVTNPVKLYDDYVAWVFSGGEGRFDFCAHSKAV